MIFSSAAIFRRPTTGRPMLRMPPCSYMLVSGGLYNGASTGSSEQSYAALNSDGSVSSFYGATGSQTISGSIGGYNFFNHAAVLFVDTAGNPHVLVLGGEDSNAGTPVSGVWLQH
jgi:hypothetical protein